MALRSRQIGSGEFSASFCRSEIGKPGHSAKIKAGGLILSCIFSYSKLIALAAAVFLLSATLDNVPDCPELLNSRSGPFVSLQLVHHDVIVVVDATSIACRSFLAAGVSTQYSPDALLAISPRLSPSSLYQAADPSPPAA